MRDPFLVLLSAYNGNRGCRLTANEVDLLLAMNPLKTEIAVRARDARAAIAEAEKRDA